MSELSKKVPALPATSELIYLYQDRVIVGEHRAVVHRAACSFGGRHSDGMAALASTSAMLTAIPIAILIGCLADIEDVPNPSLAFSVLGALVLMLGGLTTFGFLTLDADLRLGKYMEAHRLKEVDLFHPKPVYGSDKETDQTYQRLYESFLGLSSASKAALLPTFEQGALAYRRLGLGDEGSTLLPTLKQATEVIREMLDLEQEEEALATAHERLEAEAEEELRRLAAEDARKEKLAALQAKVNPQDHFELEAGQTYVKTLKELS